MKHTKQKPDCVTTDPSTPNKGIATSDAYQEGNSVLACRCVTSQVCYRQATFARQTFVQRIGEIINVFNKQTNKQRTLDRRKAQRLRTSWRTTYYKSRKNKSGLNTGLCRSPPHFGEPQLQAASCMNPHTWTLKVCPLIPSRLTGCTHGTWAHCSDISLSSSGS